jgi:hypothetical protein
MPNDDPATPAAAPKARRAPARTGAPANKASAAKPAAKPAAAVKAAKATPAATVKPKVRKTAAPAATAPKAATKPTPRRRAAAKPVDPTAASVLADVKAHVEEVPALAGAALAVVRNTLSLKKKELVERVAAASGEKRKSVKGIVEATLKVLGDALEKGEELVLPPFGKAKVNRSRGDAGQKTLMVKLRRGDGPGAAKAAKEPLADTDD